MSRPGTRLDSKKVNSELFSLTYGALVSQLLRDYENAEDVNKQLERIGYNIGVRLIEDFLAKTGSGRCYDFRDTAEKIQVYPLTKFNITMDNLGTPAYNTRSKSVGATVLDKEVVPPSEAETLAGPMGHSTHIEIGDESFTESEESGDISANTHLDSIIQGISEMVQNPDNEAGFRLYLGITPTLTNWSQAGDEFSLQFESNPLTEFVELPDHCLSLKYCNVLTGVLRGALEMVQMEVSSTFVQDHLKGDSCTEIRLKFIKRLEDAIPAGED